jgi:pyrroline-5-carboxylate reductase
MRKFLQSSVGAVSKSIGSIREMSVRYSQDDIVLNKTKLIVGDGNMMGAVLDGTIKGWQNDGWKIDILKVTPPSEPRQGVTYYHSGNLPPEGMKYGEVWLGMKPQQFLQVAENISQFVDKNTLAVSVLAGIPTSTIKKLLNLDMAIRTMPNTNSGVSGEDGRGNGQTALTTTGNVPEGTLSRIISDCERIGDVHLISEDRMNPFTAVAGSGPAYAHHIFGSAYRILREKANLSQEDATKIVLDAAIRPLPASSYSEKVRNALSQLDSGKGSLEGVAFEAAKSMGNCTSEELSCFIAGTIAKVSRSLVKGSESLGFSDEMSRAMISGPRGIIRGSALTAEKTGKTFLELKNAVTSVNGTTQAALGVIEAGAGRSIDDLCKQGLQAACDRGEELGNPLKASLKKSAENLTGASENSLESAESELVAVHNASKQALLKLQRISGKKVSRDDSEVDYGQMKSLQNPEASSLVVPKEQGRSA